MHSSFRISNSSDSLPLNVGVPSIFKLNADKRSEELRIFVELSLEATKLSASTDEDQNEVTHNTETLLVEPHSFNVVATPLTREFLLAEEKVRAREAARVEREELETFDSNDESDSEPFVAQVERRKSIPGKSKPNSREVSKTKVEVKTDSRQIFRKSQNERAYAANVQQELPDKKPPDICLPPKPSFSSPLSLPTLPTTPIPVSELPPTSVRSPPLKSPPINPLLQNLLPIPPKQYTSRPPPNILNPLPQQKPVPVPVAAPPTPSPARSASSDLISIQVPMAGPDGSQTLQTINVPRSVLAGASDRPILLTVTPKNGINKGQKQIVVLTKNNSGTASTSKTATISTTNMTLNQNQKNAAAAPAASPCKSVQLSPRAPTAIAKPTQLSQTSVNALLAASKPVAGINSPMVVTSRPDTIRTAQPQQVITHGQLATQAGGVRPQPASKVVQQVVRPVQAQPGQVVRPPLGQAVRTMTSSQPGQVVKPGQTSQVIRGHIVQTSQGQVLVQGNKQILLGNNVIQNGKLVLNQAQLQALTGQLQTQGVSSGQVQTIGSGQVQQQAVSGGQLQSRVVSGGQVLNQGVSGGQIQSRVVSGGGQLQNQVISGGQIRTQVIAGGQLQTQGLPVRSVMSVSQLQSMVSSGQLQTVLAGGQLQTVVSASQPVSGVQMHSGAQSQTSGPHIVSGRANAGQVILGSGQVGQVISQGGIQKVLTGAAGGGQQYVRVLASGNGVQQQTGVKQSVAGFALASHGGQIGNNSAQFISSPANSPAQGIALPNGSSGVSTPSGVSAAGDPSNNSLSRILTALHNRGLVSQQNGKFYYVGDKSKSPVSLSPGAAFKLAASTGVTTSPVKASLPSFSLGGVASLNSPISGITSLTNLTSSAFTNSRPISRLTHSGQASSTQQSQARNTASVVVAAAANLDSYTADPSMLQMANSLLQSTALSPDTSFNSNATNNSALLHAQSTANPSHNLSPSYTQPATNHHNLTNGLAEVSPLKTTSQGEINNQTFYYRDLALPVGWYIRIDKRLIADYSYEVDTSFFSPDGAMLKSQAEISAYLIGQLRVEDLSHRAPVSVNLLPWKEDLNEINKQFVPNIDIAGVGGFTLNDATSQNSLKRSLASQDLGVCDEKKSKSENFLFL